MPPISGRLYCPLEVFIYLQLKFLSYFFGTPTQVRLGDVEAGGLNVGLTSAESFTARTLDVLDEPHFPLFRLTRPLTSPFDDYFRQPQSRKPVRRAVLVGVEDINELPTKRGHGLRPLKGPHKDIREMRQHLIDRWHYHPDDIILLMNDPETLAELQPTRKNIEKHCVELVAGACKGDCFFFHFAGHTMQKKADGEEEEDGKDEYIVTSDNDIIQDNDLRKMLVDPLPAGAKLVAVFDACNSATLLDLEHHRCNRVFVPWINKGFRRTRSQWKTVVRRCAFAGSLRSGSMDGQEIFGLPAINFSPNNSTSLSSVMLSESPTTLPAEKVAEVFPKARPSESRRSTTIAVVSAPDGSGRWYNCSESPILFCDSPFSRFCTGHCRTKGLHPQHLSDNADSDKADVICLSSAKDSQRSWQTPQISLTQLLIEYLKKSPNASIRDVLTAVSHGLHAFYVDMHQDARDYIERMREFNKRRIIKGKKPRRRRTVEMDNFQDPQMSSHKPLNMDQLWEM